MIYMVNTEIAKASIELLYSSGIAETFAARNEGSLVASSFWQQTLRDLVPVDYLLSNRRWYSLFNADFPATTDMGLVCNLRHL